MSRRPRIGLCAAQGRARWGVWDEHLVFVPHDYVRAVQRARGAPVILPPDPDWTADPDEALDGLDALILCGGIDVGPAAYGEEPHHCADAPDAERDSFEIALARRALERDLPFLGVCRGMQLMNVAAGGTLVQHLPDRVGHERHRERLGVFAEHPVRLDEGSLAALAAGESLHRSQSHHHQAVDRLGDGLHATGWSEDDGVVEAIEAPGHRFALGVQWHPEVDETSRIIAALVDEARRSLTAADREEALR